MAWSTQKSPIEPRSKFRGRKLGLTRTSGATGHVAGYKDVTHNIPPILIKVDALQGRLVSMCNTYCNTPHGDPGL